MDKIIITDVDECVLQWKKSFEEFIKNKDIIVNGEMHEHKDIDNWIEVNDDEFMELLYEFNHSVKFGNLDVGYKSEIFIPLLHDMGYKFYALTSCGSSETVIQNRILNIKNIFGDIFEDIICIDLCESKNDKLKSLPYNAIWVEDKFSNAELGLQCNHKCFLIHHNHNEDFNNPNIQRVEDWEEIYYHLLENK